MKKISMFLTLTIALLALNPLCVHAGDHERAREEREQFILSHLETLSPALPWYGVKNSAGEVVITKKAGDLRRGEYFSWRLYGQDHWVPVFDKIDTTTSKGEKAVEIQILANRGNGPNSAFIHCYPYFAGETVRVLLNPPKFVFTE